MVLDGFLVAFLVGLSGGLANLLVDIPALWNYDWSNGLPSYNDLLWAPHRHLHTPVFCLLVSSIVWIFLAALVHGC